MVEISRELDHQPEEWGGTERSVLRSDIVSTTSLSFLTFIGLSLREMIHEFKFQTLVLFKSLLLQPKVCEKKRADSDRGFESFRADDVKMLFFGSRCERLCMIQFSLISLIPGLVNNLRDCADPALDSYAQNAEKPSSLKTSERSSCKLISPLPLSFFVDICSACLYGSTFADFWQGMFGQYRHRQIYLTSPGEHVWTIHAITAAGSACRPWD